MVEIAVAPPCARFSLRGPAAAFALPLPGPLSAAAGALWLGPEEWLLLAEPGTPPPLAPGASVVEVSAGFAALELAGPEAPLLLNEGCPLDLADAAFPPGRCTRSLFGKVEIILWRREAGRWRVEVARSLAPHLLALLHEAAAELG